MASTTAPLATLTASVTPLAALSATDGAGRPGGYPATYPAVYPAAQGALILTASTAG